VSDYVYELICKDLETRFDEVRTDSTPVQS